MTTLHDFGGVLGRPLDTFFWALTISWSRLLARVKWPLAAIIVGYPNGLIKVFVVDIRNTIEIKWPLSTLRQGCFFTRSLTCLGTCS